MGLLDKLLNRQEPNPTPRQRTTERHTATPFAAVAIEASIDGCCQAAADIAGKRFLTGEAPLLQLPDCTEHYCRCRYVRFDDRREGPRRDADHGIGEQYHHVITKERRAGSKGRRNGDTVVWTR